MGFQLRWKSSLNRIFTKQFTPHELVASASATKIGHEINPDFKIDGFLAMPAYGMTANPLDQLAVHEFENQTISSQISIARGNIQPYNAIFKENGIEIQFAPGDEEILKNTVLILFHSHIYVCGNSTIHMTIRLEKATSLGGVENPRWKI